MDLTGEFGGKGAESTDVGKERLVAATADVGEFRLRLLGLVCRIRGDICALVVSMSMRMEGWLRCGRGGGV